MTPEGLLPNGYLWEADLVRFAFILGLVLSVAFYERYHVTTGSLIVPAYFAIFILQPTMIAVTLMNAYLTFLVVYRFLPRYTFIYGRAKFFVLVPMSILLQLSLILLTGEHAFATDRQPFLVGIGYVIPAVIAHDFGRQGVGLTVTAISAVSLAIAFVLLVIAALIPGLRSTAPLPVYTTLAFELRWVPVAILASAMASTALVQTYGFKSGGFVGSAYVALTANNLVQVAFVIVIATLTYLIVVRLLMRHMILFGRRKFAAMLLVGGMLAWVGLGLGQPLLGLSALPFAALPLSGIVVPSLFANDAERAGVLRVIQGATLNTLFTLSCTLLVESLATSGLASPYLLHFALLAAISSVLVFGRYFELVHALVTTSGREARFAVLRGYFNRRSRERIVLPSERSPRSNVVVLRPDMFEEPLGRAG